MADDKKQPDREAAPKRVFCIRNQCEKSPDEHLGCPYCFGKKKAVESGERCEFCDFDPEKDPTSFGFPEGASRNLKG